VGELPLLVEESLNIGRIMHVGENSIIEARILYHSNT